MQMTKVSCPMKGGGRCWSVVALLVLCACAGGEPIAVTTGDAGPEDTGRSDSGGTPRPLPADAADVETGADTDDELLDATPDVAVDVMTETGPDAPDVAPGDAGSDADPGAADADTAVDEPAPNTQPVPVVDSVVVAAVDSPVTLDAARSYDPDEGDEIVEFLWQLSDGRELRGVSRDVVFDTSGVVDGTLTVTDTRGAAASAIFRVEVGPRLQGPAAVIAELPEAVLVGAPLALDGSASTALAGTISAWEWTLTGPAGETVSSVSGARATVEPASVGDHVVRLDVIDDSGASGSDEATVYAGLRPQAVITVLTDPPEAGAPIALAGTDSTDLDDDIVAWNWRLPDGSTPSGPTATFLALGAGRVAVSLTVRDEHGFEGVVIEEIDVLPSSRETLPPICSAGADRTLRVGEASSFVADCTDPDGEVVAWRWDFGDGTTSDSATAFHSWAAAGEYTVVLTGTDDDGEVGVDTVRVVVTAPARPPVAAFTWAPSAAPGVPLTFDATGSVDPDGDALVEYRWDFGDGTEDFGATVVHTFAAAGSYPVTLRVLDATGLTGSTSRTVTVDCAPDCLAGSWRMRPLDSELPAEGGCADGFTSITVTPVTCDIGFVGTAMTMDCGGLDVYVGTIRDRSFTLNLAIDGLFDSWCGGYSIRQSISGRFVSDVRWEGTSTLDYFFDIPIDCYGCNFPAFVMTGTRL